MQSRQTGKAWRKTHLAAIRKANSNWSKERRAAVSAANTKNKTGTKASKRTRRRMSKSHCARFTGLCSNQCEMCTSKEHTTEEHQSRLCAARRKSKKWKRSVQRELKKRYLTSVGKPIRFPSSYLNS